MFLLVDGIASPQGGEKPPPLPKRPILDISEVAFVKNALKAQLDQLLKLEGQDTLCLRLAANPGTQDSSAGMLASFNDLRQRLKGVRKTLLRNLAMTRAGRKQLRSGGIYDPPFTVKIDGQDVTVILAIGKDGGSLTRQGGRGQPGGVAFAESTSPLQIVLAFGGDGGLGSTAGVRTGAGGNASATATHDSCVAFAIGGDAGTPPDPRLQRQRVTQATGNAGNAVAKVSICGTAIALGGDVPNQPSGRDGERGLHFREFTAAGNKLDFGGGQTIPRTEPQSFRDRARGAAAATATGDASAGVFAFAWGGLGGDGEDAPDDMLGPRGQPKPLNQELGSLERHGQDGGLGGDAFATVSGPNNTANRAFAVGGAGGNGGDAGAPVSPFKGEAFLRRRGRLIPRGGVSDGADGGKGGTGGNATAKASQGTPCAIPGGGGSGGQKSDAVEDQQGVPLGRNGADGKPGAKGTATATPNPCAPLVNNNRQRVP